MVTRRSATRKPRMPGIRRGRRDFRHAAGLPLRMDELHLRAGELDHVAVMQRHRIAGQRHAVDHRTRAALDVREDIARGAPRDGDGGGA